jgi:hypothetical protein
MYVTSDTIGKTVAFTSLHPSDGRAFRGIVTGIFSYAHAIRLYDIVSYHAAIVQAHVEVESDPSKLTFFSITLDSSGVEVLMANEYIVPGSYNVVNISSVVMVEVIEPPSADHTKIIDQLKAAGYTCRIVSVT